MPGEHDVLDDDGKQYLERYGKGTKGAGWYSFDHKGVHFIGLVNVMNLKAGGLGDARAASSSTGWKDDVAHLKASTPIVVFAHIPLWTVYPEWGWGTEDSAQALASLKTIRIGDGAERAHSPDDAEGGRQRDVPYGDVDGVSAAGAGHGAFAGADESAGGAAEQRAGDYGCECGAREAGAGGGG